MSTINNELAEINNDLDFFVEETKKRIKKEHKEYVINNLKYHGNRLLELLSLLGMGLCELKFLIDKAVGILDCTCIAVAPVALILVLLDHSFSLSTLANVGIFVGMNAVWFGLDIPIVYGYDELEYLLDSKGQENDDLVDTINDKVKTINKLKDLVEKITKSKDDIANLYQKNDENKIEEQNDTEEIKEPVKFNPYEYTEGYTDDITDALNEYQALFCQAPMPTNQKNPSLLKTKRD